MTTGYMFFTHSFIQKPHVQIYYYIKSFFQLFCSRIAMVTQPLTSHLSIVFSHRVSVLQNTR